MAFLPSLGNYKQHMGEIFDTDPKRYILGRISHSMDYNLSYIFVHMLAHSIQVDLRHLSVLLFARCHFFPQGRSIEGDIKNLGT